MRGDAEQDVLDVVEGADVNELAALDERIEERGTVGALEAAGEEPVLAADRDDAQLALGAIVVDGDAAIVHKALQGRPLIPEIAKRVTKRRLRQHGAREVVAARVDLREQRDRLLATETPARGRVESRALALD